MSKATIALALAITAGWGVPAAAQQDGSAAIEQELNAMRAEMARMAARIDTLEAQLVEARSPAADPPAPPAPAAAPTIAFKGAPEITGDGGWSFKPRGRLQFDAGTVSAPAGINDSATGFGSEIRRAYLGVDGKMPGGFGYRAEIDVAGSSVEITDLYLTYAASDDITLTVGQHKPFWGLEEITSDLFTSFTERAAINTAFGYERRLGASASFSRGAVLVQGGVFTDNVADLNDDGNNSHSFDTRAVFMPKLAGGQFHLGGSAHYRKLNDAAASVRYRVRPFIHTPDLRFIDTGAIPATGESGYGLEAAWLSGPFHATGEMHWQHVDTPALLADPTFFGGYAEVGLFLTRGDTRGYRGGVFDRVRPRNPVGKGGFGAVQVNLRYDRIDLNDRAIMGGTQDGYAVALVWTLTDYVKFLMNYGHLRYGDAAVPGAGGNRDYSVDAFGVRAQIDF